MLLDASLGGLVTGTPISSGLLFSHHCDIYNIVYKQFLPHCLTISFWSRGVRLLNLITEIQSKQLISSRWERVLVSPSHAASCECLKLLTEFQNHCSSVLPQRRKPQKKCTIYVEPQMLICSFSLWYSMTVKTNWMHMWLNMCPYLMCVMSDNGPQEYVESRKPAWVVSGGEKGTK